jgi:hypothetical protein
VRRGPGARRAAAYAALALLLSAAAGCGDDEPTAPPAVTDADRARIAAVINEAREAFAAGDGEKVCDALLDEGQEALIRIAGEEEQGAEVDSCEAAVEELTGDLTARQRRRVEGEGPYRPADVDVDPSDDPGFNDRTDTVPEGGPQEVEVPCLEGDGNSLFLEHAGDGTWKLAVPFCSGR